MFLNTRRPPHFFYFHIFCCHGSTCRAYVHTPCLFSKVPKSTWSTLKVDTPVLSFGHKCSLLALATTMYKHRRNTLDVLFSSNRNIHKSSCGLCFWASDPLIHRFYENLSIKGSEAQKQKSYELLWSLWFDGKSIFSGVYP